MLQIRNNIFETNSSSTHTLTMCTGGDLEKWKNGELVYSYYDGELVPVTDEIKEMLESGDYDTKEFVTWEHFNDWSYIELESFLQHYKTPGGEDVVAFGYYGYDG